jgi:hypothetical protein
MKKEQSYFAPFYFFDFLKISLFCKKSFFFLFKIKDLEAAFLMSKGSPFYMVFIVLWYYKINQN